MVNLSFSLVTFEYRASMQLDNAKALGEKLSGNGTRECLTVHDDQLLHLLQTLLSHHLQQLAETTAQNEGRKRGGGSSSDSRREKLNRLLFRVTACSCEPLVAIIRAGKDGLRGQHSGRIQRRKGELWFAAPLVVTCLIHSDIVRQRVRPQRDLHVGNGEDVIGTRPVGRVAEERLDLSLQQRLCDVREDAEDGGENALVGRRRRRHPQPARPGKTTMNEEARHYVIGGVTQGVGGATVSRST